MKKGLLVCLVLMVASAGGIWIWPRVFSSRRAATEERRAEAETESCTRTKEAISAMASRNNARTDWDESLIKRELTGRLFTFQINDAMMRDSRPILAFGYVDDITNENGRWSIYFREFMDERQFIRLLLAQRGPNIRFFLECSLAQVESIVHRRSDSLGERYAFIASVSSMNRPAFEVKAKTVSADQEDNAEGVGVEVESSTFFVARGKALELLHVGDYARTEDVGDDQKLDR